MVICDTCLKNLQVAYQFKKLILKTQDCLKAIYDEINASKSNKNAVADTNEDDLYLTSSYEIKSEASTQETVSGKNNAEFLQPNCDCKLDEIDLMNGHICFKKEYTTEEICIKNDDKFLDVITIVEQQPKLRNGKTLDNKNKDETIPSVIYQCNACDSIFNKRWKLKKHVTRHHIDEKKFQCTYCNRSFKQSYHLREHLTIHTGERNYVCNVCGKSFQRLSSQRRHVKSHEAAPGQKTKRTPFLCTICGKSFPFSNGVQRHMRTHTGIKQHECQTCGKRFTQSTHLHVHMRTHTGEKPYVCDVCGEAFSLKYGLRKHMNSHNHSNPKHESAVVT